MDEFDKNHLEEEVSKDARGYFEKVAEMRGRLNKEDFILWSLGRRYLTLLRLQQIPDIPAPILNRQENLVKKCVEEALQIRRES